MIDLIPAYVFAIGTVRLFLSWHAAYVRAVSCNCDTTMIWSLFSKRHRQRYHSILVYLNYPTLFLIVCCLCISAWQADCACCGGHGVCGAGVRGFVCLLGGNFSEA
jgi:hypothetical protein